MYLYRLQTVSVYIQVLNVNLLQWCGINVHACLIVRRMSSNLRSIAYDLHYCPGSKNYQRQNKMTFFPELYIVALKKKYALLNLVRHTKVPSFP
jgi:hypothetical protein